MTPQARIGPVSYGAVPWESRLNPAADRDLAALLPEVRKLVADAGAAILEVYAGAHDVEYKSDDSPITRADRAAHEILSAGLRRLTLSSVLRSMR